MLKQKSEKHMLNKTIYRVLAAALVLQLTACSVTNDTETSSINAPVKSKTYAAAISAMKSGNLDDARDLFLEVINKQPKLANAHVNIAIIFIQKESFSEAENSLNRALDIDPNNIYALNQLGYIFRTQGAFSKAEASYQKAININSNYANAHLNIGILYDLYLYDLNNAVEHYKIYNELSKEKDKQVEKWIFDLERRINKAAAKK